MLKDLYVMQRERSALWDILVHQFAPSLSKDHFYVEDVLEYATYYVSRTECLPLSFGTKEVQALALLFGARI